MNDSAVARGVSVWTVEGRTEAFIDLVRAHPYLYDVQHPEHRDRPSREQAWRDIQLSLSLNIGENIPVTELKNRWRYLRDYFWKNVRTMRQQSSGSTTAPWPLFNRLLFICTDENDRRIVGENDDDIEEIIQETTPAPSFVIPTKRSRQSSPQLENSSPISVETLMDSLRNTPSSSARPTAIPRPNIGNTNKLSATTSEFTSPSPSPPPPSSAAKTRNLLFSASSSGFNPNARKGDDDLIKFGESLLADLRRLRELDEVAALRARKKLSDIVYDETIRVLEARRPQ